MGTANGSWTEDNRVNYALVVVPEPLASAVLGGAAGMVLAAVAKLWI